MQIVPNYTIKTNYNNIYNQHNYIQYNKSESASFKGKPRWKNKKYRYNRQKQKIAHNVIAATTAIIPGAAGIKTAETKLVQNERNKVNIQPTMTPEKERFAQSIDSFLHNSKIKDKENFKEYFLEGYDISPEYAIKFFNMQNDDGIYLRDLLSYQCLGMYYLFHEKNYERYGNEKSKKSLKKEYDFLKTIINLKDSSGTPIYSRQNKDFINNMLSLCFDSNSYEKYSKGVIEILTLEDSDGNLRFPEPWCDSAMEFFTKAPETAKAYANMRDENNNLRFSLADIGRIGRSYGYHYDSDNYFIPISGNEGLDTLLNLKRDAGSYIFKHVPNNKDYKIYEKYPKEALELLNMKLASGEYAVDPLYLWTCGKECEQLKNCPDEDKETLKSRIIELYTDDDDDEYDYGDNDYGDDD